MTSTSSIKGPSAAPTSFPNASSLRIGIVHARWNQECIDPLVKGCVESITKTGVKMENIVIESVPGSWELPIACSRLIAGSQIQASQQATDLMSATTLLDDSTPSSTSSTSSSSKLTSTFDAVIAIGVLIKGSTMHFEYISDSTCSGLMRVGLDTGIPVILGVLTALTENQALERSGITTKDADGKEKKGHNHGLDWGSAAVEMASKNRRWTEGKLGAK